MASPTGLSIDQIVDWHRVNTSSDTYIIFSDADGSQTRITWETLGVNIYRCEKLIRNNIAECRVNKRSNEPTVVGLLADAASDKLMYITMFYAHLRLTHPKEGGPIIPFLISPHNSSPTIARLIEQVNVKYIWVTDGPIKERAVDSLKMGGHDMNVRLLRFPSYTEIYETKNWDISVPWDYDRDPVSFDAPALILHSSGTTGFPTPVVISHRNAYRHFRIFVKSTEATIRGERLAIHFAPIYHTLGYLSTLWPAALGVILAIHSPKTTKPLAKEYLQTIVNDNCSVIVTVPNYLEIWSSDPKSIKILQKMKYICWSGGPLRRHVGEVLYSQNIPLIPYYGATEFGGITMVPKKPIPEGYEWFRFAHGIVPVCLPIDSVSNSEPKLYKLYLKKTDDIGLAIVNTEIDGCPAYDTKDIVQRHPLDSTLYHIVGRYDEQIMLSTGKKINPVPLEQIMENHTEIKRAVIFGRGYQFIGVLILPESSNYLEKFGVEGFINQIWPAIEDANAHAHAPSYSKIYREMILLASPSKPFLFTDKGTVKKNLTLKSYAEEIEHAYKAVGDTLNTDVPVPEGSHPNGGWTEEESLEFVKSVVHSIMGQSNMRDTDDLFSLGCDSLQVTFIERKLMGALKQVPSSASAREVHANFIYEFPTIQLLARYLAKMSRTGFADETVDPRVDRRKRLKDYVDKYTQNWPVHKPRLTAKDEIVLLTGSTGSLGSQILAQLIPIPSVSRIYAFNRRSSKSSYDRHLERFKDGGSDLALLNSPKIVFVIGETSEPGLGIDEDLFREMQERVTTIIHTAWQVNFRLKLESFEPAIRGVRNLIDFALNSPLPSPPTLLFTSSIGIIKNWADVPVIPEKAVTDIDIINRSGYGESKWVSERILGIAEENTALKPVILRVGQLSGGLNGSWNTKEWFPTLVRVSQVVGGLPNNEGLVFFLPLHIAASAVIELRSAPINVAHVVHPRPIPWKSMIEDVSEILKLPIISNKEWVSRLEQSLRTDVILRRNSAPHLLDFYRVSILPEGRKDAERLGAMGVAIYDTSRTASVIHSLDDKHLPQLSKGEVERWISYWRTKGYLDRSESE